MKKYLSLLLAVVLVLSLAVGCGQKSPSTPGGNPGENPSGTPDPADSNVTYKESIVIGTSAQIATTDPQAQSNLQHDQMFKMTHDRLVNYNSEKGEIEPELAESWEISDDNLVYTFHLVKGVTFHNGSPFTSDDVVATIQRGFDSSVVSAKLQSLDSIEAIDENTVRMTLKAPNVDWLMNLSNCVFSITSRAAIESDPVDGPSIGTGAWIIKDFSASNYVTMVRNDNYWGELPVTKEVTLRYIAENATRLISLQNGEIDMCIDPSTTELSYITDDANLDLVQYQSSTSTFLCFNTSTEPGNNKDLRLAIAHAINVDEVIKAAVNGYATRADHFWGPDTYGYDSSIQPYEYNLDLAKQYMEKAGYPNGGVSIKVLVNGSERMTALQVIQSQLKEIGVDIIIEEVDSAGISAATTFASPTHEAMLYFTSWNYEGDDCRRMFYTNSNVNKAHYVNQEVIDLVDKAVTLSDDAERMAVYAQIQQIIADDAPWIPLYFGTKFIAINKNLDGVIYEPNQRHDFTYVRVAG